MRLVLPQSQSAGPASALSRGDRYSRPNLDMIVEELCAFSRHSNATMRCGITRQDSHVHAHAVAS